jgi:hypothetical protein
MLFGDFLNNIAGKAGIKTDDADLTKLLSIKEVATLEVPESIANKIESTLMSTDAAISNRTVRDAITAQLYNGFELELKTSLDEHGLDDAVKAEILKERKFRKIPLALKKIKELEMAKASGKGDKAEMQKEIDSLQASIKTIKEDYEKKLSTKEVEKENFMIDHSINSLLSQYSYALPKEMDAELKVQTARIALNKELQNRKGKITLENGASKLVNAETGSDYYDEKNNKLSLKDFTDSVMAQYKLLAVSNGQAPNPQSQVVSSNGASQSQTTSSWEKAMNEAKQLASEDAK